MIFYVAIERRALLELHFTLRVRNTRFFLPFQAEIANLQRLSDVEAWARACDCKAVRPPRRGESWRIGRGQFS